MRTPGLFRRRPVIALTLAYAFVLVIVDRAGFFAHRRCALEGIAAADIRGHVLERPEEKPARISFPLRTESVNGIPLTETVLVTAPPGTHVAAGDFLRLTGRLRKPPPAQNEGSFDYANYLARQGVFHLLSPSSLDVVGRRPPPFYRRWAEHLRAGVVTAITEAVPPEEASVLLPMVIGEKSFLSEDVKTAFTDAGVMHVLVVSGMNVAYVSAIFLFLFKLSGLRRRYAALMTIPFILLYALMTGMAAPILRASVMALFVVLSLGLARQPGVYQSLGLAALTILLVDPQSLFTASFQLSFAATLGIVTLYAPLLSPFEWLPAWIRRSAGAVVAVSLAAQIAVAPLLAYYFNKISVASLASNLFVVPLVGLITAAGILLSFVYFFVPFLTAAAAQANMLLIDLLLAIVTFFARMPAAVIPAASPPAALIPVYYLSVWGIFRLRGARRRIAAGACGALVVAGVVVAARVTAPLSVTFLAIGNADAVHVRFPTGEHWLIDAGKSIGSGLDTGERVIGPYLRSKGVRRLDRVVVTHPHLPHYGGMGAVLRQFPVGGVVLNPDVSEEREFVELLETIREKKIPWKELWAGDRLTVGEVSVTAISPEVLGESFDDNCLALSLEYGAHRLLLTGDMSEHAIERLLSGRRELTSDVLQLPNHGRRKRTAELIAAVAPDHLVVTGRPPAGPGANVYSTGRHGQITFDVTPDRVAVRTFRINH